MRAENYRPLPDNSYDKTHNRMQRQINQACEAILAVLDPNFEANCPCCGGKMMWEKVLDRQLLRNIAERHYRTERGANYELLSSSIWSLAIRYLESCGVLDRGGLKLINP